MEKKKKTVAEPQSSGKSVAKAASSSKKSSSARVKSREDAPETPKSDKGKETKKISSKNEKKEPVRVFEQNERSKKLIHQIMPYLLMFLSVFIIICFVLTKIFTGVSEERGVGVVGKAISDVLCGLFGFGAFFVPILLGFVSVQWSRAVEKNCLLAKPPTR